MTIETRALLQKFYTAFNDNDMSILDKLVAEDIVDHNPSPDQPPGREGLKLSLSQFVEAFPDVHIDNQAIVCEGDLAMVRSNCRGTHTGSGPLPGMTATGVSVEFTAIDNWRIENGQLAEVWHVEEVAQLLAQLAAK